jgi:hypothetical protein
MAQSKFETSLESGIHSRLQAMAGSWTGTTKTWFEPETVADESPMTGTIRPVLGGRFLMHEYQGSLSGKPFEGIAIYGFDLGNNAFQSAWVDSFHMSTGIMFSQGGEVGNGFSVLGSYGGEGIPTPWGWRTVLELVSPDELIITAYNISPEGQEDKATETVYKRIG